MIVRPLREAFRHPPAEFGESQFLFALEPDRDVLFLRPRMGVAQSVNEPVISPKVRRVIPADAPAPLNIILEQSPTKRTILLDEELPPSRLIRIPFPDLISQRFAPISGAPYVIEELPPSRFIKVTPADNLFLYVYQSQGHLHGLAQPIDEVRAPKVVTVTPADILPSLILLQQRPLIAIPQPEIIVPASRIIRVPFADVFAPPAVGRKLRRRWFRSGG